MYERLSEAYAACEAFALGTGPSPEPLLQRVPRFA
jgi:hypothetical protein